MNEPAASPLCFVVMWFDGERRPVYDYAIKPAAEDAGYYCQRTDDLQGSFSITHQIVQHIFESRIIVADLTGSRPNVFYEAGIAHVLGHKTILICDKNRIEDIPFDLRDYHVILYEMRGKGLQFLRTDIYQAIEAFEDWRNQPAGNPVQRANPCCVLKSHRYNELLQGEELLKELLLEKEHQQAEINRAHNEIQRLRASLDAQQELYSRLLDRLQDVTSIDGSHSDKIDEQEKSNG